ncbi:dTDP-4-dehydrorhamnose reductase [Bradyrhizobium sp. dw_411]|uniref:dTDP-4-dehydrorhamnose reductase n=1 Tax=Bradyrhizobium sp. dw_411 TaxID=2720082 RepID=UPI001BCC870D|nr:dTDP-4-dehydrorhamnose reductase [Bradyrhizobium sp. dw_411]
MTQRPLLIAGKNGQVARCLRDLAFQQNIPIVAVGRPELDLEDKASIDRVLDAVEPSAVINAAAYTAVDRAETEPAAAFAINCNGAAEIADAARRRRIPFLHLSTDYVFDGEKKSPYVENDITAPLNIYGASKLAGEVAVLKAHPGAVILRTSWIYSPYGNNFVKTMLRLSETQPIVKVVDDQRGAPTSAAELASAVLKIVARLQSAGDRDDDAGIYHLAGEGEASWHEFASAIFASLVRRRRPVALLRPIGTDEYPTPARRPRNSCLDCSRAERVFGVRLASWRSSLEVCLDQLVMDGARAC